MRSIHSLSAPDCQLRSGSLHLHQLPAVVQLRFHRLLHLAHIAWIRFNARYRAVSCFTRQKLNKTTHSRKARPAKVRIMMEYWRQCALWLINCKVLAANHRVTWESAQVFDLAQTLRDGVLLCHLLNNLRPQSINLKEINLRPQMSQVRNHCSHLHRRSVAKTTT